MRIVTRWPPILVTLVFLALTGVPDAPRAAASDFAEVTGPCAFSFPRDHGPHPAHRTEWWYVTGNLEATDGRPYGFQITIFRVGTVPPEPDDAPRDEPEMDREDSGFVARGKDSEEPKHRRRTSAWRARDLYLVHTALSDPAGVRFHHHERAARGALNLAGALNDEGKVTLFVGPNEIRMAPEGLEVSANAPEFSFYLDLKPVKAPIPHGAGGYSRKGESPASASCYYSMTRLEAAGTLTQDGTPVPVLGLAWLDHEYSSAPLETDIAGWDWFSLQLSDGSELMIYLMRRKDGGLSSASSGTYVAPDGTALALDASEIRVRPTATWQSPRTGAVYPSGWSVSVPRLGTTLAVTPRLRDQEMETPESTRVTYWEGSVGITGDRGGNPVTGVGYVELTGYAGPVRMR